MDQISFEVSKELYDKEAVLETAHFFTGGVLRRHHRRQGMANQLTPEAGRGFYLRKYQVVRTSKKFFQL